MGRQEPFRGGDGYPVLCRMGNDTGHIDISAHIFYN